MVDVTFRGPAPTSEVAERALRSCIQVVVDTKYVTAEVLGTVWYSKSGKEADDKTVTVMDGSDHLVYKPETKQILTWNEREGGNRTVEANEQSGYVVVTEVNKNLVPPSGRFIHVSIVFAREPTERVTFEAVIAEVKKAIAKQSSPVSTTGFAKVGKPEDPAAWRQIRGSDGKYISVTFDPNRPGQLMSGGGENLGPSGRKP